MSEEATREHSKSGAPECGLYLITPPVIEIPSFLAKVRDVCRVANASEYEKNMHVLEYREATPVLDNARMLCEQARHNGMIFIVHDNIDLALEIKADGVLLRSFVEIPKAKRILGDDAIIGLYCGNSQKDAEQALSHEVDYVSFAREHGIVESDLVAWWSTFTDKLCVVEGQFTNDTCGHYVRSGASFIDGSHYIWDHPESVMKGTVNMLYAIELALGGIAIN